MVLLLFFMIRKGAHMYSDRQTELSVFLEQLRQSGKDRRKGYHSCSDKGGRTEDF